MFGDESTNQVQDQGSMQPMDPALVTDPGTPIQTDQPAEDHQMTPAYPDDSAVQEENPVMQMHQDAVAASPAAVSAPNPISTTAPAASDDYLLAIKQDALTALSPLVGSLDQSPEEKFRTTMMLIQASDDKTLVHAAYEAAQAITDQKIKAQALLDVVNEINYFTSHTA